MGLPGGDPMMTEYVVMHVLRLHRGMPGYQAAQTNREWRRTTTVRPELDPTAAVRFHQQQCRPTPPLRKPYTQQHHPIGIRPPSVLSEHVVVLLLRAELRREALGIEKRRKVHDCVTFVIGSLHLASPGISSRKYCPRIKLNTASRSIG